MLEYKYDIFYICKYLYNSIIAIQFKEEYNSYYI